jgi:hypothetical protein
VVAAQALQEGGQRGEHAASGRRRRVSLTSAEAMPSDNGGQNGRSGRGVRTETRTAGAFITVHARRIAPPRSANQQTACGGLAADRRAPHVRGFPI